MADLIQVTVRSQPMPRIEDRAGRRKRHTVEVEASQAALRKSISATKLLVEQSDVMLRRHREECEAGESDAKG